MRRSRPLALIATIVIGAACSESPTAPPPISLAPSQPDKSVLAPILLPPGAKWGLYFTSFNTNRNLNADVFKYDDGRVGGSGTFVIPGVGIGTLRVTTIERTYGGCVPERSTCDEVHYIPESAVVSGVGRIGWFPMSFTLDLKSNLWPAPGPNPGTNYDRAFLTICRWGVCKTTDFYGELHHEGRPPA